MFDVKTKAFCSLMAFALLANLQVIAMQSSLPINIEDTTPSADIFGDFQVDILGASWANADVPYYESSEGSDPSDDELDRVPTPKELQEAKEAYRIAREKFKAAQEKYGKARVEKNRLRRSPAASPVKMMACMNLGAADVDKMAAVVALEHAKKNTELLTAKSEKVRDSK